MSAPRDHDSYLATLPPEARDALQRLREQVSAVLPKDAREVMSYGIPAWRAGPGKGKVIVGYAAMKAHLGFYAFDGDVIGRLQDALAEFSTAKGTVRFTPDHPIPEHLVHKIVSERLSEAGIPG